MLKKIIKRKSTVRGDNVCGIGWFSTTEDDPFFRACERHDLIYVAHEQHDGERLRALMLPEDGPETRARVDRLFYNDMLRIAGADGINRLRAKFYYALVRAFGWMWWISIVFLAGCGENGGDTATLEDQITICKLNNQVLRSRLCVFDASFCGANTNAEQERKR
jgi:hypothetical protein